MREFTTLAFRENGIELHWQGKGIAEQGVDAATGRVLVRVSPKFFRPTDVVDLWGDPTKARTKLGWDPRRTSFARLVQIMAAHDRALAEAERGRNGRERL